jgi:hypothetical protein
VTFMCSFSLCLFLVAFVSLHLPIYGAHWLLSLGPLPHSLVTLMLL